MKAQRQISLQGKKDYREKKERKGEEKRLRPSAVVRRGVDGQKVIVESSSYTVRTFR